MICFAAYIPYNDRLPAVPAPSFCFADTFPQGEGRLRLWRRVDDLRFKELRLKINPQSGTYTAIIAVDTAAIEVDRPGIKDTRGAITIVAGRPQPPPADL